MWEFIRKFKFNKGWKRGGIKNVIKSFFVVFFNRFLVFVILLGVMGEEEV